MTFASVQDIQDINVLASCGAGSRSVAIRRRVGAEIRLSLLATIFVAVAADLGDLLVIGTGGTTMARSPDRGADQPCLTRSSLVGSCHRRIVVSEILRVMDEA